MRIALICVHYPPLRSSCAVQMNDLAQEMLSQGHEPIVLVPSEGLQKTWASEMLDGVHVYRFAAGKTMGIGLFCRAINEMLMPFSMLYGLFRSDCRIKEFDAVVWYSPTIFFGPLISVLKHSSKCSSYLILRDIFPEWTLDLGVLKKGIAYYWFKLVAEYQYSVADVIGVQTVSNLVYFEKWANKADKHLEVLHNWLSVAPKQELSFAISETCLKGRKIFVYIGNMGIAQGMDILVDLAGSLQHRDDIGFLFVGRGTEIAKLQNVAQNKRLNNILFYDEIDSKQLPSLLSICHVGLIALDPRHKSHNIPGKFLTYMQAGLPVLARINADTDLEKLIEKEIVGRIYLGNDVTEFKSVAEQLLDNDKQLGVMSQRGVMLSQKLYSSDRAVKQIVASIKNFGRHME